MDGSFNEVRVMDQLGLFGKGSGGVVLRVYERSGEYTELDFRSGAVVGAEANRERAEKLRSMVITASDELRYVGLSALHKEIRRGDLPRVREWARLLGQTFGASRVKQYVKRIVLEETRNTDLLKQWESARGTDAEQMCLDLAASPKKWELPGRTKLWAQYCAAWAASKSGESPEGDELDALLFRLQSTRQLRDSNKEKEYFVELTSKASALNEAAFVIHRRSDACHGAEALIEVLGGVAGPSTGSAVLPPRQFDVGTLVVPPIHPYVYDVHTRVGARVLSTELRKVVPGKPLPAQVDLRWTGMVRGVGWRTHAFAQYGADYKKVEWEAVEIPELEWQVMVDMDSHYYPRFK